MNVRYRTAMSELGISAGSIAHAQRRAFDLRALPNSTKTLSSLSSPDNLFVRLTVNWFRARHVSYDGEEQRVSLSSNSVPNIPASEKIFPEMRKLRRKWEIFLQPPVTDLV
jgi:hypothetical protein